MENEENLTAIEWLMEQIVFEHQGGLHPVYNEDKDLTKFFKKALKMEKEQIITTFINGQSIFDKGAYRKAVIDNAEAYYNQTFDK
jgi:hypothetical protein